MHFFSLKKALFCCSTEKRVQKKIYYKDYAATCKEIRRRVVRKNKKCLTGDESEKLSNTSAAYAQNSHNSERNQESVFFLNSTQDVFIVSMKINARFLGGSKGRIKKTEL